MVESLSREAGEASSGPWASLAPGRDRARPPSAVGAGLREGGVAVDLAAAVAVSLEEIAAAMDEAFPENILGDLDHLGWALAAEAAGAKDPSAHLGRATSTIVALVHLFGQGTAIRFRYVHDFIYGFDWAKWVREDPARRAEVGPYDLVFLERMVQRGHELLDLITADDRKYPRLHGPGARNPFGFSRDPADELRLHHDLAARALLPVEAYRLDAVPSWDAPYAELRVERARALGIAEL